MALAATSCMDILDVAPEDQIASENMWTTEELADKGMAGLYFPFYATQLSSTQLRRADGLDRQGIEAMGFATDYYSNNYPVELLSLATKPANDFQVWYEWKFCYTIIHACDDAIANLHKADMSANKLARYQCEARFLRAWAYNRLNMLYQGVPVYLEPINNEDCTRGQSSVDEVWQVILDDLTYCINNPDFPKVSCLLRSHLYIFFCEIPKRKEKYHAYHNQIDGCLHWQCRTNPACYKIQQKSPCKGRQKSRLRLPENAMEHIRRKTKAQCLQTFLRQNQ